MVPWSLKFYSQLLVLRLRQSACNKIWTRDSVLKDIEARKTLSKNLKMEVDQPPKPLRSPKKEINSSNTSLKKRRQSYLRSASVQEELDEDIQALTGSDIRSEMPLPEEEVENSPTEDSVESLIDLWYNT